MTSPQPSQASYRVVVDTDVAMQTRDGVTLYADVYRPDADGRFPVLVVRTPYDKSVDMALTEKDYFPPRGYVVVVQDTRAVFVPRASFIRLSMRAGTATTRLSGRPACRGRTVRSVRSASRIWAWCSTLPRPSGRPTCGP